MTSIRMINIQHTKLQIHGCLLIMVKPKWILHYWCLKCFYSDMAPECRDDKLWPISRCSIHPWSCYLHLVKDSPRTIAGKMGRSPSELIITIRKLPVKEAAILASIGMCITSSGARVFDRFSSLARNAIVWSSHTQQLVSGGQVS